MVGNPVLGFLQAQPIGDNARATVTKTLRWLGIALLAAFAFNVLNAVLSIAMTDAYGGATVLGVGAAITGIVFGLVLTGLACFWITYTIAAWSAGQPNGSTHALIIGILAAVFGGLGVLGGLGGGLVGAALFSGGVSIMYSLVNTVGLLLSAFQCFCGVMILVNRGKATATTGTGTATTN